MDIKFSELIEKERAKRGIGKPEMALLLGMSERMYGYYQNGKYDGQPGRIEKYLKKLSESISDPPKTELLKPGGIHEGKALHFYLKLEHGGISRFAKAMEFADTSYSYMYELFNEEKISDVNWGKFKEKAGLSKADVMLKYQSMQSTNFPTKSGVPVYDIDFTAGDVTQFTDFQETVIGHIDLNGFRKCIAFVKVKGNSMFPTFTAGDLVGLEPQDDFKIIEYGAPYAVVTKTGQSLIKFIRRGGDNDNLVLRSNNKDYDDIDLHKGDILKLFKAHGPVRDSHY